jgi:hypothetical protein
MMKEKVMVPSKTNQRRRRLHQRKMILRTIAPTTNTITVVVAFAVNFRYGLSSPHGERSRREISSQGAWD